MIEEENVYQIQTLKHRIEQYVIDKGLTYMEALLQFCEDEEIDPSSIVASKLPKPIMENIEAEAMKKNLLKYRHETLDSLLS